MQIDSGVRSVLAVPWIYRLTMRMLRNEANHRWFIDQVLALREGQKLVDVGCGPATVLDLLPAVKYVGVDISEPYIQAARETYGNRGVFLAGRLEDWRQDARIQNADIVLTNGVLHHIDDDEATQVLKAAHAVLNDNGRFVFYEPCHLIWQSKFSTFFMSKDRGQNIRTEEQWKELAASVFPNFSTHIVTSVNRLSYNCIVGQCYKTAPADVLR